MTTAPESQSQPAHPWRRRLRRFLRVFLTLLLIFAVAFWWKVLRIVQDDHWPPPANAVTAEQSLQATTDFVARDDVRRDDVAISLAPSTASDARFYLDGTEFFPAMLDDINAATSSINILMFAIADGDWGDRFAAALIEKAQAGVDVRLIIDRQASKPFTQNEELYRRLADGGVHIVVNDTIPLQAMGELPDRDKTWQQDELGQADHRKMMVIDGTVAWVGGAGLEDHFADGDWLDTFTRVQGDVVRQLQLVFITSYHAYGGSLPADLALFFPEPADPGDIRVTVLQNIPGGFQPGTQASQEAIENASTRLDILNPYFTDAGMVNRVDDAAQRGVPVRIATSADSNNAPAAWAMRSQYGRLFGAGAEIVEVPGVLHAKVTVADDTVILGSINYDAWSLYRNLEISLMFEDAGIADEVVAQITDPVIARGTVPAPPDGLREQIPAHLWWWLRYFL